MSDIDNDVVTTEGVEVTQEDRSDKLSNREALEQAILEKRSSQEEESSRREPQQAPTHQEVRDAVDADPEPPSEFSEKGKEAWKNKDIRGIQEEYRRLNTSRLQELSRAQTAERRALESTKPIKDLAEKVRSYLAVRGEDDLPDEVKIAQAIQLVNELKKGDKAAIKAELKSIGIDLDGAAGENTSSKNVGDNALLQTVNHLLLKEQEREFKQTAQTFGAVFDSLTSQKTRTGESAFPDLLDTSEKGIQFAEELGSLTQDPRFQAGVLRRFPDADLTVLVREAYKYLGGKVSGEPVTVSSSNTQKHIERSRRAAASAPQGSTMRNRSDSSSLIGKLSNRAALVKALEERQEH